MPFKHIYILTKLVTNCYNRVITKLGLTNTYFVKNRIDQGEMHQEKFFGTD
ncbi:14790_t:CDS:1, partial [Racocetra fulgida]